MKTFSFPNTASCRIVYNRQGVTYSGTLPTPITQQELLVAMSARQSKVDDIIRIEAVEPKKDFDHPHPAMCRMQKLVANTERQ
jgi:hypothetical protein